MDRPRRVIERSGWSERLDAGLHQPLGWLGAASLAATLGGLLGCPAGAFLCGDDDDCGTMGQCEGSGYCSFPDDDCPSMRRYGEHAGDGLAGACVPLATGSTDTTTSTTTPPASTTSTTVPDPDGGTLAESTSTGPLVEDTGTTSGIPDMGASSSTGAGVERVTEGLLALYLFDEQRGVIVHDHAPLDPPLDLVIEGDAYTWQDDGLAMDGAIARGMDLPDKILAGCQATNELTVEAWITPAVAIAEGPGRIVTYSDSPMTRNFTLGQGLNMMPAALFVARLRTSDMSGDENGQPDLIGPRNAAPVLTHVLHSRSFEGIHYLYVDGVRVAEGVRTGDFSSWDPSFEFACGNELTVNRPFSGTFHLVAVYDHALSEAEIQQNIDAGF